MALETQIKGGGRLSDRLTVGVGARLSRYLQVLTQAKKMGKERISSQEISEYTDINATQIRRDLSGFGKFGKRGVGYSTDLLIAEIRTILRTQGQHNIALFGAGRLGQAIASSTVLAVPAAAAQSVTNDLVDAGVKIVFNYSEALLSVPPDVTVHTTNPAAEL